MSLTYFIKHVESETGTVMELWTATSSGGTGKVADVGFYPNESPTAEPSSAHAPSKASGGLYEALTLGNKIYFTTYNPDTGTELWSSDGTTAGTGPIADIASGPGSSFPNQLTYFNGEIYFSAYDSVHNRELWKTDGTAAGTVLVADINLQPPNAGNTLANGAEEPMPNSGANPRDFVAYDGALYFTANDGINGNRIWKTDGTTVGTVPLLDVAEGANIGQIVVSNGLMFFVGADEHGWELYVSDGTAAGTTMLTDFAPDGETFYSSNPSSLTAIDGVLYFSTQDDFGTGNLWRTDGTPSGTLPVTNFPDDFASVENITKVGDTIFFVKYESTTGLQSLWKTNGTLAGTAVVYAPDFSFGPYDLTNVNGTLYFTAYDGDNGYEIWKSDGTTAGTARITDLNEGPNSANPNQLQSVNGQLQFIAYDGTSYNLYAFDGTVATLIATGVNEYSTTSPVTATTDLNGDATSDILWFNAATGAINAFEMHNGVGSWTGYGTMNPGWTAQGAGDFNGDGVADILFRRADGAIGNLTATPDGSTSWQGMGMVDSAWAIAGVADVDNDGTTDLIYTDAVNGTAGYLEIHNGAGTWHGLGFVNPDWHVAGTGDINGDGTSDLIYVNETTGHVNALSLATGTISPSWSAITQLDTVWTVAGVGDFNGDGTADILAYDATNNGRLRYLEMHNGASTWKSFTGINAIGSAWSVAGVGDYNNDGVSDILFYNDGLSAAGVLTINATGPVTWAGVGAVDPAWKIA